MPISCQVTFYRELLDPNGHPHDVAVHRVLIRRARTRERAVAAAKRRFERSKRLSRWDRLAHSFEVH